MTTIDKDSFTKEEWEWATNLIKAAQDLMGALLLTQKEQPEIAANDPMLWDEINEMLESCADLVECLIGRYGPQITSKQK